MYNSVKCIVKNGEMSDKEQVAYVDWYRKQYPDREIEKMTISILGANEVEIECDYHTKKFQRIRRITGYLVGTLDRFNNAKRSEVRDRVKHNVTVDKFEDVYID